MARKISTIKHKQTGVEVDLLLNLETLVFEATFGRVTFSDKDGNVVVKQVLRAIEESRDLEFRPVIGIELSRVVPIISKPGEAEGLELEIRRFYYAEGEDGELWRLPWDYDGDVGELQRLRPRIAIDFHPPCGSHVRHAPEHKLYYLPYTEELWARLAAIVKSVKDFRGSLTSLLNSILEECLVTSR